MAIGDGATRSVVGGFALAAVSVVSFLAIVTVFLAQAGGQRIDESALRGARIGQSRIIEHALSLLHLVSGVGLVLATLAIAVVACTRRRWSLAAAAVVIVGGANITTQVLKYRVIDRPNVGIDTYTVNSLPSGHTTVAVSLAVALVLVAPPRLRGICAVIGAAVATLMGVATLAAGWHRPSDVVAAALVVAGWTGLVGAGLAVTRGRRSGLRRGPGARTSSGLDSATAVLATGGLGLLALALMALWRTSRLTSIPTDRFDLFIAYAGGAAGIGAVVSLVLGAAIVVAQAESAPGSSASVVTTSDSSVKAKVSGA